MVNVAVAWTWVEVLWFSIYDLFFEESAGFVWIGHMTKGSLAISHLFSVGFHVGRFCFCSRSWGINKQCHLTDGSGNLICYRHSIIYIGRDIIREGIGWVECGEGACSLLWPFGGEWATLGMSLHWHDILFQKGYTFILCKSTRFGGDKVKIDDGIFIPFFGV